MNKYKSCQAITNKKLNEITNYFHLGNYIDFIKPCLIDHIKHIKLENVRIINKNGNQSIHFDWNDGETIWSDSIEVNDFLKLYYGIK